MKRLLSSWASLSSHLIGQHYDIATPILNQEFCDLPVDAQFVISQLFSDCHLSAESVLILVKEGKAWDAEIILRSVFEGSIKLTYILNGSKQEIANKADEYWNVLPLFAAIKRSRNAKQVLEAVEDASDITWLPLHEVLLPDIEVERIQKQYPKSVRSAMEQKWSCSEIMLRFGKSDNMALQKLSKLMHGYSMGSHLIHKDADGIGMVWERYQRDDRRQDAVFLAHSARLVSDVCAYSKLRLLSLLHAVGKKAKCIDQVDKEYDLLYSQLRQASGSFSDVEYTLPQQSSVIP